MTQTLRLAQAAAAAVTVLAAAALCSHVKVTPNKERPDNPDVVVEASRPEASYSGPAHPFDSRLHVFDTSLKLQMFSGETQCYYYVLLANYHVFFYISSLSSETEDVFDAYISNSDGEHIASFTDKSTVSHQTVINSTDTYEICIFNPQSSTTISFSAFHYVPSKHEKAMQHVQKYENISDVATASLTKLEELTAQALNHIRNKPHELRDLHVLQGCNSRVQQKAICIIFLMLLSAAGTTLFIRRLFRGPVSRASV